MQHLPQPAAAGVSTARTSIRTLPHKHGGLCLHLRKRPDSTSILPNQIYSERQLKGTFNQPLRVCLSIWQQQQSSQLGVV